MLCHTFNNPGKIQLTMLLFELQGFDFEKNGEKAEFKSDCLHSGHSSKIFQHIKITVRFVFSIAFVVAVEHKRFFL